MHKTTEELKNAMYHELNLIAGAAVFDPFSSALEAYLERLGNTEQSLSARLEEQMNWASICSDAYTHQQQLTRAACVSERETWAENHELKSQVRELQAANDNGCRVLMELRESLDALRNQHQAMHYANGIAGGELREARVLIKQQRELIKRQRQSIGQLKQERNDALHTARVRTSQREVTLRRLREALKDGPCTSAQSERENAPGSILSTSQAERIICSKCYGSGFNPDM